MSFTAASNEVHLHKSATSNMEKECAKCKVMFSCDSAGTNCWCETVQLSPYTLRFLKENFTGCLCPACLQPFAVVDLEAEVEEEKYEDY
jgi:hypothetical protein